MNEGLTKTAYFRMNQLMALMVEAAEKKDKAQFVALSDSFIENAGDFLEVLRTAANVTDDDIRKFSSTLAEEQELTVLASSEVGYRLPVKTAQTSPVAPPDPAVP